MFILFVTESQMYEELCDLEKDTCNWTPTPECSFVKEDLFNYDPALVKHKEYCNSDEEGITLFWFQLDDVFVILDYVSKLDKH